MRRLVDHQTLFIEAVMGAPASMTDEQIEIAHQHLGVTEQAFVEMLHLLEMSLRDFGVSIEDIAVVLAGYRDFESRIVTSGAPPAPETDEGPPTLQT